MPNGGPNEHMYPCQSCEILQKKLDDAQREVKRLQAFLRGWGKLNKSHVILEHENAELRDQVDAAHAVGFRDHAASVAPLMANLGNAAREARKIARTLRNTSRGLRGQAWEDGLMDRIISVTSKALAAVEEKDSG